MSADLSWSEDGRPRSNRFDDIYYAPDGLAEARNVFLAGCGLPQAWAGRRRFTVAELGFGTGLNMLALLQLWRDARPCDARLHMFSVEAFPLSAAAASRALAAFPEAAELAAPLLARWPGRARGFTRIDWPELNAVLDVAVAEAAEGLSGWSGPADAWFLDGFAPSRNPEMWRPEVLDLVRARSAPGARLATFTVAGSVRRGLTERGFQVEKAAGHGSKRERLQARLPDDRPAQPPPPRVAVIGAGIAGVSLARAFARLGAPALVLDPSPGGGASGNPAALVSPRLDASGGPVARLYAQAFTRAADVFTSEAPDSVVARGVLRLASGPKDPARFEQVAKSELFPSGSLRILDEAEAGLRRGAAAEPALWMDDALTIAPAALLERWSALGEARRAAVEAVSPGETAWRVLGPGGDVVAEAEIVVLAAGFDAARWLPGGMLEAVRGQASWTRAVDPPGPAASWGGYLAPLPGGGVLFGATHARGDPDRSARPEDDRRNLDTLAERLPEFAAGLASAPLESRAGLRAATPDRLPLAGVLPGSPALFVLGGLGGRGFTTAPLLAEHVAALALDAPSPLPGDLAAMVDPARFETRARRRGERARTPA